MKFPHPQHSPRKLKDLKSRLEARGPELLETFYGPPRRRRPNGLEWGNRDHTARRCRSGWCVQFWKQQQDNGRALSLLDVVMREQGLDFEEAILWCERWLGGGEIVRAPLRVVPPEPAPELDNSVLARAIWEAADAKGILEMDFGTPAWTYIWSREIGRCNWNAGIVREIAGAKLRAVHEAERQRWMRDNPGRTPGKVWWPADAAALLFALRTKDGTISAVHAVGLTHTDREVGGRYKWMVGGEQKKLKVTIGSMQGACIRFPGDRTKPLLLAEGPETAASVWLATKHISEIRDAEVWAMCGTISRADLSSIPHSRQIIVCADDDPPKSPAARSVSDAVKRWRKEGRSVIVAKPYAVSRNLKRDFNDLAQADDSWAPITRLEEILRPDKKAGAAIGLHAAQEELRSIARQELESLQQPHDKPPFRVIRVTTGVGKTEAILGELARAGTPAIYLCPTIKLAEEAQERFHAMAPSISSEVWRGRDQENPDAPGEKMCLEVETIEASRSAGIETQSVCTACPHFVACSSTGYLAQREKSPTVWFGSHALLGHKRPGAMSKAKVLVIDETFNVLPEPRFARIEEFGSSPARADVVAADLLADLIPARQELAHAVVENGQGPLQLKHVREFLTAEMVEDARKAANAAAGRVKPPSALNWQQVQAFVQKQPRATWWREAMVWRLVKEQLEAGIESSGRVKVCKDGRLELRAGLKFAEGWNLPTLHASATARMGIIRCWAPHAELVKDMKVATPFVRIHQHTGPTFGKGAMLDDAKTLRKVFAFVLGKWRNQSGDLLFVSHKQAIDRIRAEFDVPEGVEMLSFGNVSGYDRFGAVRTIVIAGRWGLNPQACEAMAGQLSGRAPTTLEVVQEDGQRVCEWFRNESVVLRPRIGVPSSILADRHPDELVEEVRQAGVVDEIVQAMGRGRGARRSEVNPLEIHVLGNTDLGLDLETAEQWKAPSFDEEMFARRGFWFESAGSMAKAAGISHENLKRSRSRQEIPFVPSPRECPRVREALIQRPGRGFSPERLVYDPQEIPDLEAWLERTLGQGVRVLPRVVEAEMEPVKVRAVMNARVEVVAPKAAVGGTGSPVVAFSSTPPTPDTPDTMNRVSWPSQAAGLISQSQVAPDRPADTSQVKSQEAAIVPWPHRRTLH